MPFHAPAPGRLVTRRAEHGEIVHLRIPAHVGIGPITPEHELEVVHDLIALLHALRAEGRAQKLLRRLPLRGRHFLERKPFPLSRARDIVPVEAVCIFELDRGFCALLRRERARETDWRPLSCRRSPDVDPAPPRGQSTVRGTAEGVRL